MSENPSVGVTVRLLGPGDAAVLDKVDPDVFDHEVQPALARQFLDDPRHHIAVAIADGTVIGMATAVNYIHPDKTDQLWINEVGVATPFRNRGIGKALLRALFDEGKRRGYKEAWVGTELDNTAARKMYERVGGREQTMIYYEFDL
jgi:ribosomal protein S18 acetylase RimI-like enzyme